MQRRALVVDDEASVCEFIQGVLVANGQEVLAVTDTQVASDCLRTEKFSAALFDLRMPVPDGVELTRRARDSGLNQRTPIIIISDDQSLGAPSAAFAAACATACPALSISECSRVSPLLAFVSRSMAVSTSISPRS